MLLFTIILFLELSLYRHNINKTFLVEETKTLYIKAILKIFIVNFLYRLSKLVQFYDHDTFKVLF